MFISRYGVIGSVNAVCNYPIDVKSINCITVLEDDLNKDLQIFLSDEYKLAFSKGWLGEMDKLVIFTDRIFFLSFFFVFYFSFLSFICREIVEKMHWWLSNSLVRTHFFSFFNLNAHEIILNWWKVLQAIEYCYRNLESFQTVQFSVNVTFWFYSLFICFNFYLFDLCFRDIDSFCFGGRLNETWINFP